MNRITDLPALLYKSLNGKGAEPLPADSPFYVPILESDPSKDPILNLWQRISLSESESVNLLTGFRGNGKSTELRRLKKLLENDGCIVVLIDMFDNLLMTKPVELSDFVLSLMAALAQEVEKFGLQNVLSLNYWERLSSFLTTEVELDKIDLQLKGAGVAAKLGMKLKSEPDFKERVQTHLRGHLSRLIEDAQEYVTELIDALRKQSNNPDLKVVLLVDSLEQIRGIGDEAQQVHDSVVELFSGQAANLTFPKLHIVYTIPPYLQALSKNLGRSMGGHSIISWPNIHIRNKQGDVDMEGAEIMFHIISKRFSQWESLISKDQLLRLAKASGGDLRDYFRLIKECVLALRIERMGRPDALLSEAMVKRVEEQLLSDLLPIAEEDAQWLAKIHKSKEASLPKTEDLHVLARFLDGNMIMNYLNGQPWYDIHPLLVDVLPRFLSDAE